LWGRRDEVERAGGKRSCDQQWSLRDCDGSQRASQQCLWPDEHPASVCTGERTPSSANLLLDDRPAATTRLTRSKRSQTATVQSLGWPHRRTHRQRLSPRRFRPPLSLVRPRRDRQPARAGTARQGQNAGRRRGERSRPCSTINSGSQRPRLPTCASLAPDGRGVCTCRRVLLWLNARVRTCRQAKLGVKATGAPFNVHSPRKTSLLAADGPFPSDPNRKPSLSDLSASTTSSSTPRRTSGASESEAAGPVSSAATSPPSSTHPSPQLPSSPRTSSSPRGLHAPNGIPGAVAMNRALLSNEGHTGSETLQIPSADCAPSPSFSSTLAPPDTSASSSSAPRPSGLPRPRSPNPSTSTYSNPFFGSSGAARERLSKSAVSAQSGSGKVISGLQSDLLQTRSALESTREQLRLSQRAVEALGRQVGACIDLPARLTTDRSLPRRCRRPERDQGAAHVRDRRFEPPDYSERAPTRRGSPACTNGRSVTRCSAERARRVQEWRQGQDEGVGGREQEGGGGQGEERKGVSRAERWVEVRLLTRWSISLA
jgi:hypothetical protein